MRECGTCSACCRWPEIPELAKPRGVTCQHLEACGHGCKVYADRPRSCRVYRCSWIEGYGKEDDRPDDCGVLVDQRETPEGMVLIARDLGGPAAPKKRAIKNIARDLKLPCLLVADDDPEKVLFVRGPRKAVAKLIRRRPEMARLV